MVITFSGIILWQGFGDALISLVSQAIGAGNNSPLCMVLTLTLTLTLILHGGNPRLAGIWFQTALFTICLGSLPVGLVWWYTGDILALSQSGSENVRDLATTFSRYSLLWLLPDAAFAAFYQFLNAQQLVRPTIGINVFFVLYNLGMNVLLVHGGFGFAGLGFVGSPLATASTKILRGFTVVWWVCYVKGLHKNTWHEWTSASISKERLGTFLEQAIPNPNPNPNP